MNWKIALYRIKSYVRHELTAWHTGGEGVHSPTLFYIVRMVLYDDNAYYAYPKIEQQRKRLKSSTADVNHTDYGTGACARGENAPVQTRRVADIARTHLESPSIGQLLFRLVNYLTGISQEPLTIVELGTSLGITTAYLAMPSEKNSVQTYEGAEDVADVAMQVWRELGIQNIVPVIGNIDETLSRYKAKKTDLAFIDANHTYEATMRYFRQLLPSATQHSIYVIDDIHHSPEMERAWHEIQAMKEVTSTIDCYHVGLVFFNKHYIRKHYRMRI
ncbi:MAG: class I SAM-dependent methyltransferase [Paludibacteraceae bacterium]|nr:class I SAM-dependent methyltransferase [Paludibacteraceae bacterium]